MCSPMEALSFNIGRALHVHTGSPKLNFIFDLIALDAVSATTPVNTYAATAHATPTWPASVSFLWDYQHQF